MVMSTLKGLMMKGRLRAAAVVVVLTVAVAGLFVYFVAVAGLFVYFKNFAILATGPATEEDKTLSAGLTAPLRCDFSAEYKRSFEITGISQTATAPERFMQDKGMSLFRSRIMRGDQDFKLKMHWQIDGKDPSGAWIIKAAVTDFEMEVKIEGKSEKAAIPVPYPFVIRMLDDCRFNSFGFHPAASTGNTILLMNLIQTLEMVLPPDEQSTEWEAEQINALGKSLASYKAVRSEAGDTLVTRNRLEYLEVFEQPADVKVTARVMQSEMEGALDPDNGWFKRLEGTEHTRLAAGDSVFAESLTTLSVVAISTVFPPINMAAVSEYRWLRPGEKPPKKKTRFANVQAPPGFAKMKLPEALKEFQAILFSKKSGHTAASIRYLTVYLRERPEAATEIIEALRNGEIEKKAESTVFLALQLAGAKESEDALLTVLEDAGFNPLNRSRAAHALSEVEGISQRSVDALFSASTGALGDEGEFANTSLLALGVLGYANAKDRAEITDRVVQEMEFRFQNAETFEEKSLVLAAIGNVGDERFIDEISEGLGDDSEYIRKMAINAARKIDSDEIDAMLEDTFINDRNPDVRNDALDMMARREPSGEANSEVVRIASERLPSERNAESRAAIINYLGKNADISEVAKEALVEQYRREADPQLMVLIGRYVSAEDLQ